MSGISGGVWIDAGCGRGTYSFPLAMLASQVIAIDKDPYDISFLKTHLPQKSKITVFKKDFTKDHLSHDLVDGVLFGFSLHYSPNPIKAIINAFNHLKPSGKIIIFEYTHEVPLPWVPFPIPKRELISLLEKTGFQEITIIFNNTRFYIVRGKKVSH
ncbi:MAG: class I SAM-dependent methyltransferase [Promethearchaeota archaeon]